LPYPDGALHVAAVSLGHDAVADPVGGVELEQGRRPRGKVDGLAARVKEKEGEHARGDRGGVRGSTRLSVGLWRAATSRPRSGVLGRLLHDRSIPASSVSSRPPSSASVPRSVLRSDAVGGNVSNSEGRNFRFLGNMTHCSSTTLARGGLILAARRVRRVRALGVLNNQEQSPGSTTRTRRVKCTSFDSSQLASFASSSSFLLNPVCSVSLAVHVEAAAVRSPLSDFALDSVPSLSRLCLYRLKIESAELEQERGKGRKKSEETRRRRRAHGKSLAV
jgi:hypothetical protein